MAKEQVKEAISKLQQLISHRQFQIIQYNWRLDELLSDNDLYRLKAPEINRQIKLTKLNIEAYREVVGNLEEQVFIIERIESLLEQISVLRCKSTVNNNYCSPLHEDEEEDAEALEDLAIWLDSELIKLGGESMMQKIENVHHF